MESARTRLVRPLKLVAMEWTGMAVLEMKSDTCRPGDTPFSRTRMLAGMSVKKAGQLRVETPTAELKAITRAKAPAPATFPPSPTMAWVKFPEFLTKVV